MTAHKTPGDYFLIIAVALTCLSPVTALGQWQLGLGVTDEIDGKRTGAATLTWLSPHPDPWEISVGILGQRHKGSRLVNEDSLWAGVNRRFYFDYWQLDNWFATLGLAVAEEDNEVLSDHLQFHTGVGYRFGEHLSVSVRHLSNASISGRNRGDTFLVLQFGL